MTPMGMGNPGGLKSIAGKLGGGILGQVASRMSGVVGGGGMSGARPPLGGMGMGKISSPQPMNSTLPPPMRNGGVGGVAPRPAQDPMMRKQRGRGGMSMF